MLNSSSSTYFETPVFTCTRDLLVSGNSFYPFLPLLSYISSSFPPIAHISLSLLKLQGPRRRGARARRRRPRELCPTGEAPPTELPHDRGGGDRTSSLSRI
jgi:hypothetical protein